MLEYNETDLGGYNFVSMSISGDSVYAKTKNMNRADTVYNGYQKTESSGRIHTSAATVAVLPEAEEVDIHIDHNDLRIEYIPCFWGRGATCKPPPTVLFVLPTNPRGLLPSAKVNAPSIKTNIKP